MTRRLLLFAVPPLAANPAERLRGVWRTRLASYKSGRTTYTALRVRFGAGDAIAIEEFRQGGALDWIYQGTFAVNGSDEFTLRIAVVQDPAGQAAPEGRTRWAAGESYNLGVLEMQSATRARLGGMELLKELD